MLATFQFCCRNLGQSEDLTHHRFGFCICPQPRQKTWQMRNNLISTGLKKIGSSQKSKSPEKSGFYERW
jgi:hypothetical protein